MQYLPQLIRSDDDSGMSSDILDVFLDSAADESVSKLASSDDDSDDSDDDLILDNDEEGQELSALYYLKEAEFLNILQL
jgi:hypothetical protein